jgi:MFS family permease
LLYTAVVIREVSDGFSARGAVLLALLVYAVLSAFVGWLNDRVGGAMLVVASVALASFGGIVAERDQFTAAALIGGPFLLAGLALLLAAGLYEEWRYQHDETDAEN